MSEASTKPYLIRAIHEWCSDNGYRPYIAVVVGERTQVPFEFVRNGEIVLNVSPEATNHLVIGNDLIEFEARFNGVARNVSVPIGNVTAIYAAENGQGMAFDVPKALPVLEPQPAPRTASGLRDVTPAAAGPDKAAMAVTAPVELSSVPMTKRRVPGKAGASEPSQPVEAAPAFALVPSGPGSAGAGTSRQNSNEPVAIAAAPDDQPKPLGAASDSSEAAPSGDDDPSPTTPPGRKGGRPRLTRVK